MCCRWSLIFMNYDFVHTFTFFFSLLMMLVLTLPLCTSFVIFIITFFLIGLVVGVFFSLLLLLPLSGERNFTFAPLGTYLITFWFDWNWFVSIQLRHYLLFFNLIIIITRLLFVEQREKKNKKIRNLKLKEI